MSPGSLHQGFAHFLNRFIRLLFLFIIVMRARQFPSLIAAPGFYGKWYVIINIRIFSSFSELDQKAFIDFK